MAAEPIDFSSIKHGTKVMLSSDLPFLRRRKGWIGEVTDDYIEFHELRNEPMIVSAGEAPRYVRHLIMPDAVTEIELRSGRF